MSTGNSKTNDPNIFRLYFTDKIDLRGNKKNSFIRLINSLRLVYQYSNNKFTLSGPTWSEDVIIPDGSYEYLKYKIIFLMK